MRVSFLRVRHFTYGVVGIAAALVGCADGAPTAAGVPRVPGVTLDYGSILNAEIVYAATALYPGYHYKTDPICVGHDVQGDVSLINPRKWMVNDSGVVKLTPHVSPLDSGSTATFTGGTKLDTTTVKCTIRSLISGTASASAFVKTRAGPRITVTSNTGNPTNIPPGEQRTFDFTVKEDGQVNTTGSLGFTVTGGTIVSSTARSVTVQPTGAEGSTVGITATGILQNPNLLDASNNPYSTTASVTITPTTNYDPIVVELSGLTETGVGTQCNARYSGGASGGAPPYTTSWETSGQINSQSDWEVSVGFPTVDEHYVYLQVTDSRGHVGGSSVLVLTSYQYPCQ